MASNRYPSQPTGANLGQSEDRRQLGTFDIAFVAEHGSRAQRRQVKRQLERMAAAGNGDAARSLRYLEKQKGKRR
jgi:hypothetical protein